MRCFARRRPTGRLAAASSGGSYAKLRVMPASKKMSLRTGFGMPTPRMPSMRRPGHLVQQTLGHQSLATTSRYTHARPDLLGAVTITFLRACYQKHEVLRCRPILSAVWFIGDAPRPASRYTHSPAVRPLFRLKQCHELSGLTVSAGAALRVVQVFALYNSSRGRLIVSSSAPVGEYVLRPTRRTS